MYWAPAVDAHRKITIDEKRNADLHETRLRIRLFVLSVLPIDLICAGLRPVKGVCSCFYCLFANSGSIDFVFCRNMMFLLSVWHFVKEKVGSRSWPAFSAPQNTPISGNRLELRLAPLLARHFYPHIALRTKWSIFLYISFYYVRHDPRV